MVPIPDVREAAAILVPDEGMKANRGGFAGLERVKPFRGTSIALPSWFDGSGRGWGRVVEGIRC